MPESERQTPQERAKARIAGRYDEPIREEMQNPAPGEKAERITGVPFPVKLEAIC